MTELIKSRWKTDGDQIRFSVPLSKVDRKNRLVSGWATLDNIDTQGDIVTAEASKKAFARARGNLREMHQPIAVGKIVSFREDEFFNPDDGKFYRGIFVTARVSEGAEDTWKKVLDETLTGFSIGGSIVDASNEMSKDGAGQVRIVKDYDLVELSLVDNPANQLANIFSIAKAANGSVKVEGMVAEMTLENVFICKVDGTIRANAEEATDCPTCGNGMESIGWFEHAGSQDDRAEKVRDIVNKFKTPNLVKGGDNMTDEVTKNAEVEGTGVTSPEESAEVEEVVTDPNTPALAEPTEGPDSTIDVEEVTDEEEELSKRIEELKETVQSILKTSHEEQSKSLDALKTKIEEVNSSFEKKASELEEKIEKFGEKLDVEKGRLTDLENKLEKFNSSDALKKSAEIDSPAEPVQKNTWGGAFSIDNLR